MSAAFLEEAYMPVSLISVMCSLPVLTILACLPQPAHF